MGPLNAAKTDCVPCLNGTFFNGTACAACADYCETCSRSKFACTACKNNNQFVGGKCVCNGPVNATGWCNPCPTSTFYNSTEDVCKPCAANCTFCFNETSCRGCTPFNFLLNGTCTPCSENCAICANTTGQCLACNP